jgi:hypothetical protein
MGVCDLLLQVRDWRRCNGEGGALTRLERLRSVAAHGAPFSSIAVAPRSHARPALPSARRRSLCSTAAGPMLMPE